MANQELEHFQYIARHIWQRYKPAVALVALLVLAAVCWGTMFYTVETDSRGVVLRLGEYHETTPPGLHFKWPWPIDVVYTVPVEKVQSLEFGYRTQEAGRRTTYARTTEDDKIMARMLTADLNLAHVEWVVQYQIKDANDYLFKIGDEVTSDHATVARDLIRDVSEAVMRRVIGDVSVDSVITTGREQIADDARVEMQAMLDQFESGIRVVAVKLQSATPPEPVKDAFDAVNRAKQTKEQRVNMAKGERNRMIPAARGKRDRAIAEAEGYEIRIKKEAEGRAQAFLSQLEEYEKAPRITTIRLYLEAMQDILSRVDQKIIIDESITGMLPLLHLEGGDTAAMGAGRKGGAR